MAEDARGLAIYTALTSCLATSTSTPPLSIEILPSSFPFPQDTLILVDGANVGVRKSDLSLAFLIARANLFAVKDALPQDSHSALLESSFVVLLFDSEHLTACTSRRRALLALPEASRANAYRTELWVTETLLSSPLHRHSKSPTLWFHRFWTLRQIYLHCPPGSGDSESANLFTREIDVVLKAADTHFANYYAFLHARRVFEAFNLEAGVDSRVLDRVTEWCLAHPRDVSGWSMLGYLLRRAGQNGGHDVVRGTMRRVREFRDKTDWKGVALEWFLKQETT